MRFVDFSHEGRGYWMCVRRGASGECVHRRTRDPDESRRERAVTGLAPTAPANQGAAGQAVAPALSARSGDLHVTKNCTENTGQPGSFCTITSSNVKAIEVGSRIVYLKAAGATVLDSDIVLDLAGVRATTRRSAIADSIL